MDGAPPTRSQTALLDQLWTGDRFVARGAGTGRHLDQRQPARPDADRAGRAPARRGQRRALADRIEAHLTPYGLATELPTSPHYRADGYWRGPIWAPVHRPHRGRPAPRRPQRLADDISARFRALCETSGFAENFDALTGAGLRDRAYTWTASSYLLLAEAHAHRESR